MARVAVVGAGMAGAVCARVLADAGHAVAVFDKGRSVGGRLAGRRTEAGAFDHGAQYVKARDPGFVAAVEAWAAAGLLSVWGREGPDDLWVGTPSMNAPVKALLAGLEPATGARVAALARAGEGWALRDEAGAALGAFDRVALAVPAPQAAELLGAAGPGGAATLAAALAPVAMAPCWAGMFAFAGALPTEAEWLRPAAGPLAWVARHRAKPGRGPAETWTAHAAPDWSRERLELPPAAVAPLLLEAFARALGGPGGLPPPTHAAAHRWRYALAEHPLGRPCLHDPAAGLGLCGDWCLGPRVEAAWLSGDALGRAMAAAA